jgi:hypothetical protein
MGAICSYLGEKKYDIKFLRESRNFLLIGRFIRFALCVEEMFQNTSEIYVVAVRQPRKSKYTCSEHPCGGLDSPLISD